VAREKSPIASDAVTPTVSSLPPGESQATEAGTADPSP
jgi:hypothetical protein